VPRPRKIRQRILAELEPDRVSLLFAALQLFRRTGCGKQVGLQRAAAGANRRWKILPERFDEERQLPSSCICDDDRGRAESLEAFGTCRAAISAEGQRHGSRARDVVAAVPVLPAARGLMHGEWRLHPFGRTRRVQRDADRAMRRGGLFTERQRPLLEENRSRVAEIPLAVLVMRAVRVAQRHVTSNGAQPRKCVHAAGHVEEGIACQHAAMDSDDGSERPALFDFDGVDRRGMRDAGGIAQREPQRHRLAVGRALHREQIVPGLTENQCGFACLDSYLGRTFVGPDSLQRNRDRQGRADLDESVRGLCARRSLEAQIDGRPSDRAVAPAIERAALDGYGSAVATPRAE